MSNHHETSYIPLHYGTVLLTLAGCGDSKSLRQLPHLGDTPYQQDSVLVAYATNPERALRDHYEQHAKAYADGQSFPQYVNNIRLEEALRLLRDAPSKALSAIATDIGFTPANLREQFKRKYGITPAEYRRISEEKNA